jgi:hypothetical protein
MSLDNQPDPNHFSVAAYVARRFKPEAKRFGTALGRIDIDHEMNAIEGLISPLRIRLVKELLKYRRRRLIEAISVV